MFDFTSSKLLILGIVALLVIGPKDLPALLRTVGKYVGIIKRQAAEFRAQFDEAMRESELAELRKSVESIQHPTGLASDAGVAQGAPEKAGVVNGSSHPADTATVAANEAVDGAAAS